VRDDAQGQTTQGQTIDEKQCMQREFYFDGKVDDPICCVYIFLYEFRQVIQPTRWKN
jgi:hypothetical protein